MTEPTKAEQLHLALPSAAAMGRGDFLAAPSNRLALAAVDEATGLPSGVLVITGPEGSGKTHLAHLWAARTGAAWLRASDLALALPDLLAADGPRALVLDDAAALARTPAEEALFHLLNHLRGRGQILLTARQPVRDWGLQLPDLVSRLTAAAHVPLAPPDETLLRAVLVKLFADRQVTVQPALIDYLVDRMERSLAAAGALVARLDARGLALGRPITRALASEVLASQVLAADVLAADILASSLDNDRDDSAS